VRPLEDIRPAKAAKVDERELELALTLVERFSGEFDPTAYEDRYRERLLAIVRKKRRGGEVERVRPQEPKETSDLLAALQESVARHSGRRGRGTGRGRNGLASLTVEELAEKARALDIAGRSKMTKDELVAAIEQEAS